MALPRYKLTYFNLRALAEPIRLMFVAAGVEFEDHKIPTEEWLEWKPKIKFGQLPVLEVDGKELTQSFAIMRYLAKSFNKFQIQDTWGAAKADEVADFFAELRLEYRAYFICQDEAAKEAMKVRLVGEVFPKYLGILETVAQAGCKSKGKFLGGQEPLWQDFYVASWLQIYGETFFENENFLDEYPALKEIKEAVFEIPKISAYVATREKTFV